MRIFGITGVVFCALSVAAQTRAPGVSPPGTAAPQREPGLYTTLETTMGSVTMKLFEKESPVTVKNFIDLALGRKPWTHPKTGQRTSRPLYPGTIFHRVIPEFMIQGGDPLGTGFGGSDVIPDEFHPSLKFDVPGRLAMANSGPKSGSSQFFITEVPTPHLDGKHTIFGQVVEGHDVVAQIARVPSDSENNRPRIPVTLTKITFERIGPGDPIVVPKKQTATPKKATGAAKPKATTKPAAGGQTAPAKKQTPAKKTVQ